MALSNHITDLITAYKAMPNGERRNKVISHLKDAEAHAKLLEQEDGRFVSDEEMASLEASDPMQNSVCICKPGVRNSRCIASVHVA